MVVVGGGYGMVERAFIARDGERERERGNEKQTCRQNVRECEKGQHQN